jgi:hypothetical protein
MITLLGNISETLAFLCAALFFVAAAWSIRHR